MENQAKLGPIRGKLYVKDTNCNDKYPTREHTMPTDNGGEVACKFTKGTYLILDEKIARKFLVDIAFVVCDFPIEEGGTRIQPVPKDRAPDDRIRLKDNETVARFDELTHGALCNRANLMPGGEKFGKDSKKGDVIDFLVGRRKEETKRLQASEAGRDFDLGKPDGSGDAGGFGGTMDQNSLTEMFTNAE